MQWTRERAKLDRRRGDRVRRRCARVVDAAQRDLVSALAVMGDDSRWRSLRCQVRVAFPAADDHADWVLLGVHRVAIVGTEVGIQHAAALSSTLRAGMAGQLPALALSRAVLESCCQVSHALNHQLSPSELVQAALVDHLWPDWLNESAMNRGLSLPEDDHWTGQLKSRFEVFGADLRDTTERLGFETQQRGWGEVRIREVGGHEWTRPASTTRRVETMMGDDGLTAWRLGSGASHGAPWLVTHELQSPDAPVPAGAAVSAVLAVTHAAKAVLTVAGERFDDDDLRQRSTRIVQRHLELGRWMRRT